MSDNPGVFHHLLLLLSCPRGLSLYQRMCFFFCCGSFRAAVCVLCVLLLLPILWRVMTFLHTVLAAAKVVFFPYAMVGSREDFKLGCVCNDRRLLFSLVLMLLLLVKGYIRGRLFFGGML